MKHGDTDVTFNENLDVADSSDESLAGFVHIFCDNTAATLNSTASLLYPVNAMLMRFTYGFHR